MLLRTLQKLQRCIAQIGLLIRDFFAPSFALRLKEPNQLCSPMPQGWEPSNGRALIRNLVFLLENYCENFVI